MKLRNKQNARAGFNLIEAAIVLGIVGLVVAGIWAAAGAAYENMRQQNTSKDLLALAQNIKNFYAGSGATTIDTSVANMVNMGVVPKGMIAGTSATPILAHPWGAPGTTSDIVITVPASGVFNVSFNYPTSGMNTSDWIKVCNAMIIRNANAATGTGMTYGKSASTSTNTPPVTTNPGCAASSDSPSFRFTIQG